MTALADKIQSERSANLTPRSHILHLDCACAGSSARPKSAAMVQKLTVTSSGDTRGKNFTKMRATQTDGMASILRKILPLMAFTGSKRVTC